jgi:hypothetical protein
MEKQTAVEWFVDQLEKHYVKVDIKNTAVFYQAKELEKKQQGYSDEEVEVIAKDAYTMGRNNILIGVFNKWFEQFKNK